MAMSTDSDRYRYIRGENRGIGTGTYAYDLRDGAGLGSAMTNGDKGPSPAGLVHGGERKKSTQERLMVGVTAKAAYCDCT